MAERDEKPSAPPLLGVRNLSKSFPGQKALRDVSFDVAEGEIFALVGQNGSGKSTLIKVLSGFHDPDPGGEVLFRGEPYSHHTSPGAMHFIHQDLGLIGTLNTLENLSLGHHVPTGRFGQIKRRREFADARANMAELDADFDLTVPVANLSPTERSLVAIARALQGWQGEHQLLVLDEPTTALHNSEAERLFVAVRRLARRGAGVIFVSHRLDEVLALADRVGVLRDGALVEQRTREGLGHEDLVAALAGTAPDPPTRVLTSRRGPVVLQSRRLTGQHLIDFNLELRSGEIMGVTGILGSGREELPELLAGVTPPKSGSVEINGHHLDATGGPSAAAAAGVALVPSDRARLGVVPAFSIRENVTLPRLGPLWRRGRLDQARERREVRDWMDRVDARPRDTEKRMGELSGGNQQKLALAKWLRTGPKVLVLDEPTQGVDVAAKVAIHALLAEAAAEGTAVVMVSADAKDVVSVCDRVLVLRDGRVVAELFRDQLTEARVITESLGGPPAAAAAVAVDGSAGR